MIQLTPLGTTAGAFVAARRFPFRIGRAAESDHRIEASGVWAQHCQIEMRPDRSLWLVPVGDAITRLNGQILTQSAVLHTGDEIEIGSLHYRYGLAPARLRSLAIREAITWAALAAVCLTQFALILLLLRS